MGLLKQDKLNFLQKVLPEGAVVPSQWLQRQGYSKQLIYKYVKNGWLLRVGSGAYCRPGTQISWQGVVASWQNTAATSWHIGGETALNLQGHAHYLRMGGEVVVHLYGWGAVPVWIKRLSLDAELVFHARRLFAEDTLNATLKTWPGPIKQWPLTISEPERALLELLPEVHDDFTFTHAAELMQGLTMLRPARVSELLKACTHIKAKRLFLFLADYYQHPWLARVEVKHVDLGSGKRSIVQGGKLDMTYLITVPEAFYARPG
jgi:hypothetical protein